MDKDLLQEKKKNIGVGRVSIMYLHDITPPDYFNIKEKLLKSIYEKNKSISIEEKLDGYAFFSYFGDFKFDEVRTNEFIGEKFYTSNSVASNIYSFKKNENEYGKSSANFHIAHRIAQELIENAYEEELIGLCNKYVKKSVIAKENVRLVCQFENIIGDIANATYYNVKPNTNSLVLLSVFFEHYDVEISSGNIVVYERFYLNIDEIEKAFGFINHIVNLKSGSVCSPKYLKFDENISNKTLQFIIDSLTTIDDDKFTITKKDIDLLRSNVDLFKIKKEIDNADKYQKQIIEIIDNILGSNKDLTYSLSPFYEIQFGEYETNYPNPKELFKWCNNDIKLVEIAIAWRLYLFAKEIEYSNSFLAKTKSIFSDMIGQIEGQVLKINNNELVIKVINTNYKLRQKYIWSLVDEIISDYIGAIRLMISNNEPLEKILHKIKELSEKLLNDKRCKYINKIDIANKSIKVKEVKTNFKEIENIIVDEVKEKLEINTDGFNNKQNEIFNKFAIELFKKKIEITNSYLQNLVNLVNNYINKSFITIENLDKLVSTSLSLDEFGDLKGKKIGVFIGRFQSGLSLGHKTVIDMMKKDREKGIIDTIIVSPQFSKQNTGKTSRYPFDYITNLKLVIKSLDGKFEFKKWMFRFFKNVNSINEFLKEYNKKVSDLDNKPIICKDNVLVFYIPRSIFDIYVNTSEFIKFWGSNVKAVIYYIGDEEYIVNLLKNYNGKLTTCEKIFDIEGDNRKVFVINVEGKPIVPMFLYVDRTYVTSNLPQPPEGYNHSATSVRQALINNDYDSFLKLYGKKISRKEFNKLRTQLKFYYIALALAKKFNLIAKNATKLSNEIVNELLNKISYLEKNKLKSDVIDFDELSKEDKDNFKQYLKVLVLESVSKVIGTKNLLLEKPNKKLKPLNKKLKTLNKKLKDKIEQNIKKLGKIVYSINACEKCKKDIKRVTTKYKQSPNRCSLKTFLNVMIDNLKPILYSERDLMVSKFYHNGIGHCTYENVTGYKCTCRCSWRSLDGKVVVTAHEAAKYINKDLRHHVI